MNLEIKDGILYLYKEKRVYAKYGLLNYGDFDDWNVYKIRKFLFFKPDFYSMDDHLDQLYFEAEMLKYKTFKNTTNFFKFLLEQKNIIFVNKITNQILIKNELKEFIDSRLVMEKLN